MPQQVNQPLPAGYVLNGYRIEKPLSSGGFSIVYLARDESGTPFAIKEYLPSSLALRTEGVEVKNTEEELSVFRHGLKCFFEEGRALAMISHPNVVRVENFFRANETCYMVMQYVRGRTLQFHIQRNRHEFTEAFIRRLFIHLMNGLREVHSNKLLHLDIKPANIFLTMEGRPVLLDFGAARITLSDEQSKLKPMYTAGFAAPEHYRFVPGELGPWADIYSLGATIYTCIAGTPPQAADQREKKDQMIPLKTLARQYYSEELYQLVNDCLALDHLQRPQTAFDLQKRLMEEPQGDLKRSIFETINKPLSKLFSR
ncbi:serine/threonine protein kinase [Usitatibacter palustris]|uniref:Serine/threonine-protein kinase PknD n=1 Tax=Usitatibacter palustris TaxID=2732487 RepID=A0A6M4H5X4_9PROT|nr:serine/threonine-protein kinase [Usitatibacter palustris]QJR13307.1 Serine/threonine-protein kinase PknD [Usitatibacter palustris]